jgi:tetratricopeptide (TPR) repeat protein
VTEALAPGQEAVRLYRELAEVNPDAYLPHLAASLSNLGGWLAQLGRHEEALVPAEEAVQIRRRLAEANPAAYLPDLAMSLAKLGIRLRGVGRQEEADHAWEDAMARLGTEAHLLRLLKAGWEWVSMPTYETERDYLAAHPELLAAGSEDQLGYVLRRQSPDKAKRYLAVLATARVLGVDGAYRDLR